MGEMQMVEGEVSIVEKQRILGGREGWSSEDRASESGIRHDRCSGSLRAWE